MLLYSYVVARDFGFAPNPFYGYCTLATCKPKIRGNAQVGDWIIGTGSKGYALDGHLVFAMRVTETISFDEYWSDSRFAEKRPNLHGSLKQAYGDNIYHHNSHGKWLQENSHHSLEDGSLNSANVTHDTSHPRVLISDDFAYWGGSGPEIPVEFCDFDDGKSLCAIRGHRVNFPDRIVAAFIAWFRSLNESKYVAAPREWTQPNRES